MLLDGYSLVTSITAETILVMILSISYKKNLSQTPYAAWKITRQNTRHSRKGGAAGTRAALSLSETVSEASLSRMLTLPLSTSFLLAADKTSSGSIMCRYSWVSELLSYTTVSERTKGS